MRAKENVLKAKWSLMGHLFYFPLSSLNSPDLFYDFPTQMFSWDSDVPPVSVKKIRLLSTDKNMT